MESKNNEWIQVDSYKDLPLGIWLARLDTADHCKYAIAEVYEKVTFVGDKFAFDAQKVIAYRDLGPLYQE